MPARLHPGVYVEEVPGGARAIEAAATSTAIFVGETERGPLEPTLIKGRAEYERLFGGYLRVYSPKPSAGAAQPSARSTSRVEAAYAVDAFFQNGGTSAYILRATGKATKDTPASRTVGGTKWLLASSPGSWANGTLYALFLPSSKGEADRFRIVVLYQPPASDKPRIVENWDRLSVTKGNEAYVVDVLQRSLYIRWNPEIDVKRPEHLDYSPGSTAGPAASNNPTEATLIGLATAATAFDGGEGGDEDSIDAATYAALLAKLDAVTDASLLVLPGKAEKDHVNAALAYVETRPLRDLFYIIDMPQGTKVSQEVTGAVSDAVTSFGEMTKSDFAAVYWPWVEVPDPVGSGREPSVLVAPSGHVAGLYARTDARRGVWKAPAGVEATLLGVRSLKYKVLDTHQDDLNPLGINALRVLPLAGPVVWGARTMRPDSEWRYISVRRTAIFLRKSIYNGIQWAVFEPNGEPLWASLRLSIGAFMEQQFRQGAFAGETSREAYFVKCDAETTPEADRVSGIVNVWVGFAPLRPAEFVVVKLSQKTQTSA